MLSIRENFEECVNGGDPDRFVNQFEFLELSPLMPRGGENGGPGDEWVSGWGVKYIWPKGQPGGFPLNEGEHAVIQDITAWEDVVKAPEIPTDDASWEAARDQLKAVDTTQKFPAPFYFTGIFEQFHMLQGMQNAMMNLYMEPEACKGLLKYITEYELEFWEVAREKLPEAEAIYHHDDWGGQDSSLLSPEMFGEFITPCYQQVYGLVKELGFKYIIHHNDAYSANLVPDMIKMGIDVWQGPMEENNLYELVRKYGKDISFMGGINNGIVDKEDWTKDLVINYVDEKVKKVASQRYYIPCLARGEPSSLYDGVYDTVSQEIDRLSKEYFPTL